MRNLKKFLALVLALMMVVSVMVTVNAAYPDQADINYDEAVAVMTAVGVIEGDQNGNFNPAGPLTREQAAKLVTYILLGKDAADKLATPTDPFEDVAADRWSAGSIAYCAAKDILHGDGVNFYPEQTITGHQFAALLLGVLGYDSTIEKFTGSGWEINVAALALKKANLTADSDIVLSGNLTREQAAQMAFNAIKANTVTYEGGTNVTLSDGTTIVVNATRSDEASYRSINYPTLKNTALDKTSGGSALTAAKAADAFGRPNASEWALSSDDTIEATEVVYDAPKGLELTVKTTDTDAALTAAGYALKSDFTTNGAYYVDGYKNDTARSSLDGLDDIVALANNSNTVELYGTKGAIDTVVVVNTFASTVASVTKAADAADGKAKTTLADTTVNTKGIETEAYAVDDVILYTKAGDSYGNSTYTVVTHKLATKVSGVVSGMTSAATGGALVSATVGGTVYQVAPAANCVGGAQPTTAISSTYITNKTDVTAYVNGDVIVKADATGSDTPAQFVYVIQAKADPSDAFGGTYLAQVLTLDGKTETVKIDGTDGGAYAAGNMFVSYDIDDETSVWDLNALPSGYANAASDADTVDINKGSTSIDVGDTDPATLYASANTVFLVKDATGNVTPYVGYANVPSISGTAEANDVVAVYDSSTKIAVAVFVQLKSSHLALDTDSGTPSDEMMFIVANKDAAKTVSADGAYREFVAVSNGQIGTVKVAEALLDNSTGTLKDLVDNTTAKNAILKAVTVKNGIITTATIATPSTDYVSATGIQAVKQDLIGFGASEAAATWLPVAEGCQVYTVANGAVTAGTVAGVKADNAANVIYHSNTDKRVDLIIIGVGASLATAPVI